MLETATAVETLTDELRVLVGRGIWTMRLVTCPTLREVSSVDSSLSALDQARAIRAYLQNGIAALTGTYEIRGDKVEADDLRWALRLLLAFVKRGNSADNRRLKAIQRLGLTDPLSTFRRPTSPERDVLRLLAEQLVTGHSRATT